MHRILTVCGMVDDDVKIMTVLAFYDDKLLLPVVFALDIIHKRHVAVGCKSVRLFFTDRLVVLVLFGDGNYRCFGRDLTCNNFRILSAIACIGIE